MSLLVHKTSQTDIVLQCICSLLHTLFCIVSAADVCHFDIVPQLFSANAPVTHAQAEYSWAPSFWIVKTLCHWLAEQRVSAVLAQLKLAASAYSSLCRLHDNLICFAYHPLLAEVSDQCAEQVIACWCSSEHLTEC